MYFSENHIVGELMIYLHCYSLFIYDIHSGGGVGDYWFISTVIHYSYMIFIVEELMIYLHCYSLFIYDIH